MKPRAEQPQPQPQMFQSSERMNKRLKTPRSLPFEGLIPGWSFVVPVGSVQEASFRSMVSSMSSLHNRQYRCIKHKKGGVYEVTVAPENEEQPLPFYASSPEALKCVRKQGRKIYNFEKLPEGFSFIYPIVDFSATAIRTACSLWSRKLKTKFVLLIHEELGMFEVAHVPKTVVEAYVQSSPKVIEKFTHVPKPVVEEFAQFPPESYAPIVEFEQEFDGEEEPDNVIDFWVNK